MMKRKSSLQISLYREPWRERKVKVGIVSREQVRKDNYDFRLKHISILQWTHFRLTLTSASFFSASSQYCLLFVKKKEKNVGQIK